MTAFDWHDFLKNWSETILSSPYVEHFDLFKKVFKSKWLGFDPASEEQIVAAETRLGTLG